MMECIIKCLNERTNGLLESPTGSGKSLALLCSSLAWLEVEKEKLRAFLLKKKIESLEADDRSLYNAATMQVKLSNGKLETVPKESLERSPYFADDTSPNSPVLNGGNRDEVDDVFSKGMDSLDATASNDSSLKRERPVSNETHSPNANANSDVPSPAAEVVADNEASSTKRLKEDGDEAATKAPKIPKIYFGSRTHKQLSQLVKELKSTNYRPTVAIFGSREQYCIHPTVSRSNNKNDDCSKLLDANNCQYFNNVHSLKNNPQLRRGGSMSVWDIEDLVTLGKRRGGCPYFASKSLAIEADIVFCPYNYIVDPVIRDAMEINLKDNIIVLDEAHNIEDACRESASFTLGRKQLDEICFALDRMINSEYGEYGHRVILDVMNVLRNWMSDMEESPECKISGRDEFEKSIFSWGGKDIYNVLTQAGIPGVRYEELRKYVTEITKVDQPITTPDEEKPHTLPVSVCMALKGLFFAIGYIYSGYQDDFKMVLLKEAIPPSAANTGGKYWEFTLAFWCFNSSIIFKQISSQARSVILTSGTLSPMDSFASELGSPFPVKLEAMHVIPPSSIWANCISNGPSDFKMEGTYQCAQTLKYQDEVGASVLHLVNTIPFGVLVFFPSYTMMNKLIRRWMDTGTYRQMAISKTLLQEPRTGDKQNFENVMQKYYKAVNEAKKNQNSQKKNVTKGAVFFAVCRGKVSEGLDFADEYARGVIIIGIPFPNLKDAQVQAKRDYNDKYSARGLLRGNQWYEIQAFRALNQALGRCIRHRHDFGAVILLDCRFSSPNNTQKLSRWVRKQIKNQTSFSYALQSLKEFFDQKEISPPSQTVPNLIEEESPNVMIHSSSKRLENRNAGEMNSGNGTPMFLPPQQHQQLQQQQQQHPPQQYQQQLYTQHPLHNQQLYPSFQQQQQQQWQQQFQQQQNQQFQQQNQPQQWNHQYHPQNLQFQQNTPQQSAAYQNFIGNQPNVHSPQDFPQQQQQPVQNFPPQQQFLQISPQQQRLQPVQNSPQQLQHQLVQPPSLTFDNHPEIKPEVITVESRSEPQEEKNPTQNDKAGNVKATATATKENQTKGTKKVKEQEDEEDSMYYYELDGVDDLEIDDAYFASVADEEGLKEDAAEKTAPKELEKKECLEPIKVSKQCPTCNHLISIKPQSSVNSNVMGDLLRDPKEIAKQQLLELLGFPKKEGQKMPKAALLFANAADLEYRGLQTVDELRPLHPSNGALGWNGIWNKEKEFCMIPMYCACLASLRNSMLISPIASRGQQVEEAAASELPNPLLVRLVRAGNPAFDVFCFSMESPPLPPQVSKTANLNSSPITVSLTVSSHNSNNTSNGVHLSPPALTTKPSPPMMNLKWNSSAGSGATSFVPASDILRKKGKAPQASPKSGSPLSQTLKNIPSDLQPLADPIEDFTDEEDEDAYGLNEEETAAILNFQSDHLL